MVTVQHETKISCFKIRKSHEHFSWSMCVAMLPLEFSIFSLCWALPVGAQGTDIAQGMFWACGGDFPWWLGWLSAFSCPGIKRHFSTPDLQDVF